MAVFPLLAHPQRYRACTTDLLADDSAQQYWLRAYATHTETQLRAAATLGIDEHSRSQARTAWLRVLHELAEEPDRYGKLDILTLDELRNSVLHTFGIRDEYRLLKQRENEAAIAALPQRLNAIDEIDDDIRRFEELFRGMLAGNLFDMGADATADRYASGPVEFADTLKTVPPRPWRYDGVDDAASLVCSGAVSKAVVFADNAGPDVVLGLLPMAREMLRRSIEVVVTANAQPSHNDITHDELIELLLSVCDVDAEFLSSRLQLVCSGNDAPLIDLTRISDELANAASEADLVILIGMGRAIESNFHATFTCPSWKVAMVKDRQVARSIDAELFDAVVRVESGVSE